MNDDVDKRNAHQRPARQPAPGRSACTAAVLQRAEQLEREAYGINFVNSDSQAGHPAASGWPLPGNQQDTQ